MGNACITENSHSLIATPPASSYFNLLPDTLHAEILRHVSATPHAINWEGGVEITDALELLRMPGELGVAARLHFRAVRSAQLHADDEALNNALQVDKHEKMRAVHRLLQQPSIDTVALDMYKRPGALSHALAHVVMLRHLTLTGIRRHFALSRVLSVSGRTLISLDISTKYFARLTSAQIDAIATHCVALQSLRLAGVANWGDLESLWRAVGGTLRSLSLVGVYSYDSNDSDMLHDALQVVREHCKSITELKFELFPDAANDDIATFCASYEEQLLELCFELYTPSPASLREVVTACSAVRVSTEVATGLLLPALIALGQNAVSLTFAGSIEDLPDLGTKLDEAARECSALEKLFFRNDCIQPRDLVDIVRSLLASPKHNLRSLEFMAHLGIIEPDESAAEDLLQVLAEGTGSLRKLCFFCCMPPPGAFDELARSNRELERVEIGISRDIENGTVDEQWSAEIALASIVKSFARCPNLRELVVTARIEDIEDIRYGKVADACRGLRNRHVSVCMLGVKYLA